MRFQEVSREKRDCNDPSFDGGLSKSEDDGVGRVCHVLELSRNKMSRASAVAGSLCYHLPAPRNKRRRDPERACEAGRLVDWREKFWSRRYRAIVVSGEEGAQRERLKYVLSHGAKEG